MHDNESLLHRFYEAFAARDHATMAACYAHDAVFSDPVFTHLEGKRIGAMWQMLCERGTDLRLEHSGVAADDTLGRAHWDAWYTFSATGRKVHNRIDATFVFRDGLIAEHRDVFGLYRWTRMALGPVGVLLGWTPSLQGKVRKTANGGLSAFIKKRGLDAEGSGGPAS